MTVWFSADWHLGHKKVLTYGNRPYASVEEMDEALVDNHNHLVKPGDLVYHLGDFSFYDETKTLEFIRRLNGQKYMVFGNHDKRMRKSVRFCSSWIWCRDLADIDVGEQRIVLSHYPLLTWNRSHYLSWNLHGHCHGSLKEDPNALRLDVGVDCWGMCPVSFEEVQEKMKSKEFKPVDHHGRVRE